MIYGMAIDAVPVVVANLIVAGAALYSSIAQRGTDGKPKRGECPEGVSALGASALLRRSDDGGSEGGHVHATAFRGRPCLVGSRRCP